MRSATEILNEAYGFQEQGPYIDVILKNKEMLMYLVSKNRLRNLSDRTIQMHFLLKWNNRMYGTYDEGFKKISPMQWEGQDWVNAQSTREELGELFPNLEDDQMMIMIDSFKMKRPFKNVESFSDVRTDHQNAYYNSVAFGLIKSAVVDTRSNSIEKIMVGRHYYKPMLPFNMVTYEEINNYDAKVILS